MNRSEDMKYMRRAIGLALKGEGWAHPNPMVGAVIVKDGRVIGEGYHERCGELHAERNAIASLSESAEGATIYVTLEPCCHYGRTPPCTEAIIENRIGRVVIGSRDPNPLVAGKGARILREAGIEVTEDFLKEECDEINPVFFHYITTKTPYVIMKYAMTADGKIATKTGASKWITGEEARLEVQRIRHACMGIMAGIGTVLADDPLLNCRLEGGRHPVRIICDSRLRIPEDSQICQTAEEYETIVACAEIDPAARELAEKKARLEALGVKVWEMGGAAGGAGSGSDDAKAGVAGSGTGDAKAGVAGSGTGDAKAGVDLAGLMKRLGEAGIDSVLLEGGGTLNESALRAEIVNEIRAFLAPKVFGGTAKSPVDGTGVEAPDQAYQFRIAETRRFGEDLMIRLLKT